MISPRRKVTLPGAGFAHELDGEGPFTPCALVRPPRERHRYFSASHTSVKRGKEKSCAEVTPCLGSCLFPWAWGLLSDFNFSNVFPFLALPFAARLDLLCFSLEMFIVWLSLPLGFTEASAVPCTSDSRSSPWPVS